MCPHFDEDGVVFDVAAGLQDALRHKQRAAGGDVHLCCRTPEAAAVWIRLKGVPQVFPGRSLVHQHQSHLTDEQTDRETDRSVSINRNFNLFESMRLLLENTWSKCQ